MRTAAADPPMPPGPAARARAAGCRLPSHGDRRGAAWRGAAAASLVGGARMLCGAAAAPDPIGPVGCCDGLRAIARVAPRHDPTGGAQETVTVIITITVSVNVP
jgi:hypothetical protein